MNAHKDMDLVGEAVARRYRAPVIPARAAMMHDTCEEFLVEECGHFDWASTSLEIVEARERLLARVRSIGLLSTQATLKGWDIHRETAGMYAKIYCPGDRDQVAGISNVARQAPPSRACT